MPWARYAPNGYECSSAGDKRFSALFAKLADGRTIEEAYQLDIKGYRLCGDDWRLGKGKPAVHDKTREQLFAEYLQLWETWAMENPELIEVLAQITKDGKVLTDKFATSNINQAHALSIIVDNIHKNAALPFTF